ncbi:MAG TPA: sugar phosphate isomerase/epimerase family protein [Isosphaeraceae bacterium]
MDEPVNRRDFFARSALLPLGAAAIGLGAGGPASAQAPIRRVGGPRLKTSLNAYSFSKTLNDQLKGRAPGVSLFDLLEFCAENDFDALDPTGYFFPGYPDVPKDDYLNRFKRRAFQLGVDISGTGVRNDFASPDKAKRAADVRHAKEWIECAARMGAPVLRVFAGPEPQGYARDEVFKWMADSLRECAEHGARFGVLVGVQNHGDTLKTADDVLKVVKMVDSDWFGVIVDTGYFLSPDPYQDIARVTPYAVNWQVKEKVDGAAGKSKTDLRRLVNIMREGKYRGYIPIETLSIKGGNEFYDPRARVTQLLKELREALQQA